MATYQVTCVITEEPDEYITALGVGLQRYTVAEVISMMKTDKFVVTVNGITTEVGVITKSNKHYLRTNSDGTKADNPYLGCTRI